MTLRISIVVPVKNEQHSIENLLNSLLNQTCRFDELIITDGGSTDGTIGIIKRYIEKDPSIKLITTDGAYPGKGRNLGAKAARNNLIAFTDAGIQLNAQWLEKLAEPMLSDPEVDVVYGNYKPVTDSFFKTCASIVYVPPPDKKKNKMMRHHFIASSLIKKSVWEAVGGFPDFRAAEDRIFMQKVENAGFKIDYAPDAMALWSIQPGFFSTFKRFYEYSKHDIIAGKFKDWHIDVIRMYFIGFGFILLGVFHNPWWFSLVMIAVFARVMKPIVLKTEKKTLLGYLNLKKIIMVSLIIFTIDMAMFLGMGKWAGESLKEKR